VPVGLGLGWLLVLGAFGRGFEWENLYSGSILLLKSYSTIYLTIERWERMNAGAQLWMTFPFWEASPELSARLLLLLWGAFSRGFGCRNLYSGAMTLLKTYYTIYFSIGRQEGMDAGA
jgi:hypothetical protein